MQLWQRVRSTILRWGVKQRDLQEATDVETALVLTSIWKQLTVKGAQNREDLHQIAEEVQKMRNASQRQALQGNLNEQVVRLFNAIHEARQEVKGSQRPSQPQEAWSTPHRQRRHGVSAKEQARERVLRDKLREKVGFNLRMKPSTIPTAGQGVFLEGSARIGSVVAVFPGAVYLPEHLRTQEDMLPLFPDPDFFMTMRYDKVVIDGRAADQQNSNEFAWAHMCNHGSGASDADRPNVMSVAYDFPQDPLDWSGFPQHLRSYIPNSFARPRTLLGSPDHSALVQSVVLVALTDLENQELFLNYRLNPRLGQLPPWYRTVDQEEDMRRWA